MKKMRSQNGNKIDGQDFGHWLRIKMAEEGISNGELACTLQVRGETISGWRLGRSKPKTYLLKKLAVALGTNVDTILEKLALEE